VAPKTVAVREAKGHLVVVDGLPGEDLHTAEVTAVDVKWRVAHVRFKDHPTCGSFTFKYPTNHRFVLNDKPAKKGAPRR
jgi:hypothetical protein